MIKNFCKNCLLLLLTSFVGSLGVVTLAHSHSADQKLPSNYYPYNNTFADGYIGVGFSTIADCSLTTPSNPNWAALYNPLQLLSSYGSDVFMGIRPFNKIPILRGLRIEAAQQYRESSYKILIDNAKATWLDKSQLPKKGRIYIRDAYLINGYYDMRWLSEVFYPYVGVGMGRGMAGAETIDYRILPNGVGEQYHGFKCGVRLTQFMVGVEYDTKIIKSSWFIQYSYEFSSKFNIVPKYFGDEKGDQDKKKDDPKKVCDDKSKDDHHKDDHSDDNNNTPYDRPVPKDVSYKAHAITFGVKFYLF